MCEQLSVWSDAVPSEPGYYWFRCDSPGVYPLEVVAFLRPCGDWWIEGKPVAKPDGKFGPEVPPPRALAGQAAEIETLRMRLSERCECSFEGSPRKQVTECHLHAFLRSGAWENGDPIDWIEAEERGEEIREDGGPTNGNTLRAEIERLNAENARLRADIEGSNDDRKVLRRIIDEASDQSELKIEQLRDELANLRQSTLTAELVVEVCETLRAASDTLVNDGYSTVPKMIDAVLSKIPASTESNHMSQHESISVKCQDDWQAAAMKLLRLLTDRKHGCLCVRCLEQIYNEQVAQLTTDNGGK